MADNKKPAIVSPFSVKTPLVHPFTIKQINGLLEGKETGDTYITAVVAVDLDEDVIGKDHEYFLDMLSEKLVGSTLLMDIKYKAVAALTDGSVLFEVTGDASAVFNDPGEIVQQSGLYSISIKDVGDLVQDGFETEQQAYDWIDQELKEGGKLEGHSKDDYVVEPGDEE